MYRQLAHGLFLLAALLPLAAVQANTYVVTTGANAGEGSLRWAIEQANGANTIPLGYHRIDFHASVNNITLASILPEIRRTVRINTDSDRRITIRASTPGVHSALMLGGTAGSPENNAAGSIVDQISILCELSEPCFRYGMRIERHASEILIDRVRIDRTGENALFIAAPNVVIDRAEVTRAGRDESVGLSSRSGIHCVAGGQLHCHALTVTRSHIGVPSNGMMSGGQGNHAAGILLSGGNDHQIGGARDVDGNVVGGNGQAGIWVTGGDRVHIQGNYIGMHANGIPAANGMLFQSMLYGGIVATGNRSLMIGGHLDALGNVIANNQLTNVRISNTGAALAGNPPSRIWRNHIGVLPGNVHPGVFPLPERGLYLEGTQNDVQVGAGGGHGNWIAHHSRHGIQISSGSGATAYSFVGNRIYGNNPDGPEQWGIWGAALAPPTLVSVTAGGFSGTVPMPAGGTMQVELFVDDRDQGELPLLTLVPLASGDFSHTVNLSAHNGRHLTAIATWTDPATGWRHSSGFSNAFPIGQMTLTLALPGAGTGNVASAPAGIDCGNGGITCQFLYPYQTPVELSATAAPGSYFAGWQGGGCGGSAPACTVVMGQSHTVSAVFQPIPPTQYNVNVGALGTSGAGGRIVSDPVGIDCTTSSCIVPFPEGTELTLMATANADSRFVQWSGGLCHGVEGPLCQLIVTGSTVERAVFQLQRYRIDAEVFGRGRIQSSPGGITCGPPTWMGCGFPFVIDTVVTLAPIALDGEEFLGWADSQCDVFGTGPCVLTMEADYEVSALFSDHDSLFANGFEDALP